MALTPDNRAPDDACLLVYDGNCRLCVIVKRKLERAEAGPAGCPVRFVPYQSDEAKTVLGPQYRPGRPDMAFLVRPSGHIEQGLDAFLPLAPRVAGGRLLLRLLQIPFAKRLADRLYRFIARYRYRLFGKAHPL